jgi:hypothetical protein
MKAVNFKDFFKTKFFTEDRRYVNAYMPKLFEMARPFSPNDPTASATGDVAKHPIRIDNDDIEFLQQFPPDLWGRALHARYHDDLYAALRAREEARGPKYEELVQKIKQALLSGNLDMLRDMVPPHTLRQIQNNYGPEWAERYRGGNLEKAATGAAKDIAYYAVEEAMPDTVNDEPRVYEFRGQGKGVRRIKAHPFINRLIHKLERTRGHQHAPHTGLSKYGHETGQYGYDLHGVKEGRPKKKAGDSDIPHSTQGMQMPSHQTVVDRMKDFLATNAHGIYGDLPRPGEEIELPSGEKVRVKGFQPVAAGKGGRQGGGEHVQDSFIRKKYQNPLESKYYTLLGLANAPFKTLSGEEVNPRSFPSNDKKRAEAVRLARQDIEWLKRNGGISGPPIPGHHQHWKGIPFDQRQTVHLPHFEKEIIEVDKDGREIKTKIDMPYVRPAGYFRSIGILPEDYETDEEGKIIIDPRTGQPKLAIPDEERRGYQKDYVDVHPDDYEAIQRATRRKGVYAAGALSLNQNTSGAQPLEYGHKDYHDKMFQIFGPEPGDDRPRPTTAMKINKLDSQGRFDRTGEGGLFYDDIIRGIRSCLKSADCGEATVWERNIGLNNIEEIHQIIVQRMQQNLNDPDMLEPSKRATFAKTQTSMIMQQDHEGGRTRRKRILDPTLRQTSMDRATKSAETGEESSATTQDIVSQKLRDRGFYRDELGDTVNRKQLSGQHKFPYDVRQMRALLDELRQEAGSADAEAQVAKERSRQDVGQEIITLLSKSIQDKKVVALQIYELIKKMIEVDGYTSDVEQAANEVMAAITKEAQTSAQLVANFAQHPLTRKYSDSDELRAGQQAQQQPQQAQAGGKDKDLDVAIDKLWDDYLNNIDTDENDKIVPSDQMRTALLPQGGEKVSRLAKLIASNFPGKEEAIAAGVQDAIYDALDMEKPAEQKPAVAPTPVRPQQQAPKQPIPIRPQVPAAAAARDVGTLSARERAAKTPDWKVLKDNRDFLALAFHQTFLTRLRKESLENLRAAILRDHGNAANQDEVQQALLNIDQEMKSL